MGHLNRKSMQQLLSSQGVDGVGVNDKSEFFVMDASWISRTNFPSEKK